MRIKRLELSIEFECTSFHVFHTDFDDRSGDPPTLIRVNGKEFSGTVEYKESGDTYEIKIKKGNPA
jgi:hypothetical protein